MAVSEGAEHELQAGLATRVGPEPPAGPATQSLSLTIYWTTLMRTISAKRKVEPPVLGGKRLTQRVRGKARRRASGRGLRTQRDLDGSA